MGAPSIFMAERYDDRTLIESILSSFFIVDYGFITKVNGDKTVDVTHAKLLQTLEGKNLPQIITKNVEMLTVAGKGFSFLFDYKTGDRVLLLGLKDYVKNVKDVRTATENKLFVHYSRETLKALPLCAFDDTAKVTIKVEDGNLNIRTEKDVVIKDANIKIESTSEMNLKSASAKIDAGSSLEIKSSNTKLTGGIVEIGGTVAPTGTGALCGIPNCVFSGAPHVGNKAMGT